MITKLSLFYSDLLFRDEELYSFKFSNFYLMKTQRFKLKLIRKLLWSSDTEFNIKIRTKTFYSDLF